MREQTIVIRIDLEVSLLKLQTCLQSGAANLRVAKCFLAAQGAGEW
jgi:hypothetical protein